MTHQKQRYDLETAKSKSKEQKWLEKQTKLQEKKEKKGKYMVVPNMVPETKVFVPFGENPIKVFERVRIQREVQKYYR